MINVQSLFINNYQACLLVSSYRFHVNHLKTVYNRLATIFEEQLFCAHQDDIQIHFHRQTARKDQNKY